MQDNKCIYTKCKGILIRNMLIKEMCTIKQLTFENRNDEFIKESFGWLLFLLPVHQSTFQKLCIDQMLHQELAVEMNDRDFVLILFKPLTTFWQSDVDLDQFDLKRTNEDNSIQGFTSKPA